MELKGKTGFSGKGFSKIKGKTPFLRHTHFVFKGKTSFYFSPETRLKGKMTFSPETEMRFEGKTGFLILRQSKILSKGKTPFSKFSSFIFSPHGEFSPELGRQIFRQKIKLKIPILQNTIFRHIVNLNYFQLRAGIFLFWLKFCYTSNLRI